AAGDLARGEVTLVNFWASWCPPCRAEHPRLLQMAAEGMPIIGVNFRDQAGNAATYLQDDGNPFVAVAFDPDGSGAIDWGVTAPPETFILDRDGTVLFRFQGPLVGSDYEQRFLPALEAALSR
ncbi:MAG: DsbE family thiol:disulfide interchange protein, partial [Pseudomonadota bacterium]